MTNVEAIADDFRAAVRGDARRAAKLRLVEPVTGEWRELRLLAIALANDEESLETVLDDAVESGAPYRALAEFNAAVAADAFERVEPSFPPHIAEKLARLHSLQERLVEFSRSNGASDSLPPPQGERADYIATWPPEVARARHGYECGIAASVGVFARVAGIVRMSDERLVELVDVWLQGLESFFALGMGMGLFPPDAVPGITPLDVEGAAERHAARAQGLNRAGRKMRESGVAEIELPLTSPRDD